MRAGPLVTWSYQPLESFGAQETVACATAGGLPAHSTREQVRGNNLALDRLARPLGNRRRPTTADCQGGADRRPALAPRARTTACNDCVASGGHHPTQQSFPDRCGQQCSAVFKGSLDGVRICNRARQGNPGRYDHASLRPIATGFRPNQVAPVANAGCHGRRGEATHLMPTGYPSPCFHPTPAEQYATCFTGTDAPRRNQRCDSPLDYDEERRSLKGQLIRKDGTQSRWPKSLRGHGGVAARRARGVGVPGTPPERQG